jgi:hypothetical protein
MLTVQLDGLGDEAAASFSLYFDPSRLADPRVRLSNDVLQSSNITVNTHEPGIVTVVIDSDGSLSKFKPSAALIEIVFDVPMTAPSGHSDVSFGNAPTASVVTNITADSLPVNFVNGTIFIAGPGNETVSVEGRVSDASGTGIRGSAVFLTDANGTVRTAQTGSMGYFHFVDVPQGGTFTISVRSKRYRFAPRVINAVNDVVTVDLIAVE